MNEVFLRPAPLYDNAPNINAVLRSINSKTVIAGSDIAVTRLHGAAIVNPIGSAFGQDRTTYNSTWDPNSEYYPGQIVNVYSGSTYQYTGSGDVIITLSASNFPAIAYYGAPLGIGTYICTQYVPAACFDDNWYADQLIGVWGNDPDNVPDNYVFITRWNDYNVYYPMALQSSSFDNTSIVNTVDLGDPWNTTIPTSQSYWQLLGGGGSQLSASITALNFCSGSDDSGNPVYYHMFVYTSGSIQTGSYTGP